MHWAKAERRGLIDKHLGVVDGLCGEGLTATFGSVVKLKERKNTDFTFARNGMRKGTKCQMA